MVMIQKRMLTHPGIMFYELVMKPKDLSVTDISDIFKVNKSTISRLISGELDLSLIMAKRIANFTGTTIESWYQMQVAIDIYNIKSSTVANEIKPYD